MACCYPLAFRLNDDPGVYATAERGQEAPDSHPPSIRRSPVVRIEVADAGRAKELVRVLMTQVGAEPVSLDSQTGAICISHQDEAGLALTLGAVDTWLKDSDVAVITVSSGVRSFTMRGSAAA